MCEVSLSTTEVIIVYQPAQGLVSVNIDHQASRAVNCILGHRLLVTKTHAGYHISFNYYMEYRLPIVYLVISSPVSRKSGTLLWL